MKIATVGIDLAKNVFQIHGVDVDDAEAICEAVSRPNLLVRLAEHLKELDPQVKDLGKQIITWHRNNEHSRKLEKIPAIGPLAARASVASIADASGNE